MDENKFEELCQADKHLAFTEMLKRLKGDGVNRYSMSPHTNMAVNMLIRGADPIEVIDNILLALDDIQSQYFDYMREYPSYTPEQLLKMTKEFNEALKVKS
jgi:hypothetical protein